jgi:hypothetical protein
MENKNNINKDFQIKKLTLKIPLQGTTSLDEARERSEMS